MPKTEIRYDARLMLKLESALKARLEQAARKARISTNEAARQAFRKWLDR